MKNKGTKHATFQSFVFNTITLLMFIGIGLYYIYPQFILVEEKKVELSELFTQKSTLTKEGLSFEDFNRLYKLSDSKETLLDNILTDFREDDYNEYFTHTGAVYETFLAKRLLEAKEKRREQKDSNISSKIKEILPEYTSDSSLSNDSLTDFKFVNHIESLLDIFQLSTKDKIGIGTLVELGGQETKKGEKKVKQNPLDSTIYEGLLELKLLGEKKNIINFIHYIENVGKINVINKEVSVVGLDLNRFVIDDNGKKKRNNFLDISSYFQKGINPYNGLFMEVANLEISEYIDSSDLPTPDGYSLFQLVKESQGKEKFEIDMKLRYYVKGLPTFKIEKFITGVQKRHADLLKISTVGFAYVSKNRSELKSSKAISAIGSLGKMNKYLLGIKEEVSIMRKSLAKKEKIGEVYKTSQEFNVIFETVSKKLSADLEAVSEKLYTKHKELLSNKD